MNRRTKYFLILWCALICFASGEARASDRVLCRWGARAEMDPVPRCGVPRAVEVTVPRGTYKLYFSRGDNPGLSGYYLRGRNAKARPKVFSNKINLVSVVLMLCPADFKEERILAFQKVDRGEILKGRPTCRLGPPPTGEDKEEGDKKSSEEGADDDAAGDDGSSDDGVDDATEGEPPKSVTDAVKPPEGERGVASWKKIDRYARLLGVVSLGVGLVSLVALIILAMVFQKKLAGLRDLLSSGGAEILSGEVRAQEDDVIAQAVSSQEEEVIALEKPLQKTKKTSGDDTVQGSNKTHEPDSIPDLSKDDTDRNIDGSK